MTIAIKVEEIGKKYIIKHQKQGSYLTLRDTIMDKVKGVGNRFFHQGNQLSDTREEFWALRDISFDVKEGDRVGLIGRNGAGKSTMLKILSRITEPTIGRIVLRGRVASLLEVGTGFHPELTGRENIYLNGAIIGMSRTEIKKKFDEIVEFAEIAKFLDTPVKRYSSGMYVRLAFAVAAHLEPDILLVDEVLAVGDAQFRQKCLSKMKDVGKSGRTVIFVSHNMGDVSSLCNKAIYFENGRLITYAETPKVLPYYFGKGNVIEHKGIRVNTQVISPTADWNKGNQLAIEISWDKYRYAPGWECDIAAYTLDGVKVFAVQSNRIDGFSSSNPESNKITFFVENVGFAEQQLRLDVAIRKAPNENYDVVFHNCALLEPSGTNLPVYKRDDVIVVPKVSCVVGTI